jgi:hypothetical protein
MPSRSVHYRTSNTSDIPALSDAWTAYQRARRGLMVSQAAAEKRHAASPDPAAPTRLANDLTAIARARAGVLRAWIAACRRFHRAILVTPVGEPQPHALPTCFLVRVPKKRSVHMDEFIFGVPPVDDAEGRALLARVRALEEQERAAAQRDAQVKALHRSMVEALAKARGHSVRCTELWYERAALTPMTPEAYATAQRMYFQKREYKRQMVRVGKYQRLLEAAGFVYDLHAIETPVSAPEEVSNARDTPSVRAGAPAG